MTARKALPLERLGGVTLLFYALHVACHFARGSAWDLAWVCNVAMPVLALGCFLPSARLAASALLILAYGTPMWLLDAATGGEVFPTSPLVHMGGLVLAALAVRRLGFPPRTWLFASALTALVLAASRVLTPADANVNLAFRVHDGWERYFASHPVYVAAMWSGSAVVFFVIERFVRRVAER